MVVIDLGKAVSPVAVTEAKAWMRIDGPDQDETLALLLSAASEAVESELGLAVSPRSFRLIAEGRPANGQLVPTKTPVVSVDLVLAYARDGAESAFEPGEVAEIAADRTSVRLSDAVWRAGVNGVDVTVTAGFARDAVPAEIRHAILVAAATWFESRTAPAETNIAGLPNPAQQMLRPVRRIAL